MANGDGVLRERHFPAGAEIELITPIAVIAADGENIPYGRPYCSQSALRNMVKPQAPPNVHMSFWLEGGKSQGFGDRVPRN
jgi:hypothetical protein